VQQRHDARVDALAAVDRRGNNVNACVAHASAVDSRASAVDSHASTVDAHASTVDASARAVAHGRRWGHASVRG